MKCRRFYTLRYRNCLAGLGGVLVGALVFGTYRIPFDDLERFTRCTRGATLPKIQALVHTLAADLLAYFLCTDSVDWNLWSAWDLTDPFHAHIQAHSHHSVVRAFH